MKVTISSRNPVQMIFLDRTMSVLFMYNNIQVVQKDVGPGYWLYFVDSSGHCYIKKFYGPEQ